MFTQNNESHALTGTRPLTITGDLAAQMVAGIDRFLTKQTEVAAQERNRHWQRDFSSPDAYSDSVEPNRQRLRRLLGAVDPRQSVEMHLTSTTDQDATIAQSDAYDVLAVRWDVLSRVDAEGLLLEPKGEATANVIALSDCDWTPEMLVGLHPGIPRQAQFAHRLAQSGCRVLIPTLIDRDATYSGIPGVSMTNQPHREFLYRAAYELGRHIIGYELQKVLAGVDWFREKKASLPIGVFGYGEGGLLALYAGALDVRAFHGGTRTSRWCGARRMGGV